MPTAMDKRFKSVASSFGILPAESRSAHRKNKSTLVHRGGFEPP
jgi:hypothetical protein